MKRWKRPGPPLMVLALAAALVLYAASRYQPETVTENKGFWWYAGPSEAGDGGNAGHGTDGSGNGMQDINGAGKKGKTGLWGNEEAGGKSEIGDTAWLYEQKTIPTQPKLPVSEGEEQLLTALYGFMETKNMVQAATLLNENQEQFKVLTDKTLGGAAWLFYVERTAQGERLYRMRRMESGVFGEGMVLTRFNTVFFGTYADGLPEGQVLAVQTMILDYPRYTFADGFWRDGKMNGEGRTGYRYYDGKPEGNFEAVLKTGTYTDNLMDGELIYEADNGSGRVLHWNIRADAGVTVLDEKWIYYPFSDEYMLRSEEDEDRAYVISGETKEQARWNNLILWEN